MNNRQMNNRLKLDINTKLQINIQGLDGKLNGEFAGIANDRYIMATISFDQDGRYGAPCEKILRGNSIIIRYICDGKVFGFESTVLDFITIPLGLLFINYPTDVEEMDLRRQRRLTCFLPAKLMVDYNSVPGAVVDISKTGCRFQTKVDNVFDEKALLKNNDVTIEFLLPGVEDQHSVDISIKNYSKQDSVALIGIQFTRIKEKTKRYVDSFISSQVMCEV
ncbi:MAG: flagellar brake protein [Nitrospirae bacterium]|nr:flagellar brake protein [Nitrospirota bacterium]